MNTINAFHENSKLIIYNTSIYNQLLLNSLQVISQKYGRCF